MGFIYIFLLASIFLLAVLLSIKDVRYGFWLVLILSPLVHKEVFSLGLWDLLPSRITFMGLTFTSLILFIRWIWKRPSKQYKDKIQKFIRDPFLILLILLWILRGSWIIKSADSMASIKLYAFYTSIVGLYIVFRVLISKYGDKFLRQTINIYLGLGIATGFFAVLQYYLRVCCRKSIGAVWVIPGFTPRLGSTFWDVNHYGGFLVTLIPVFFALASYSKNIKRRIWMFAAVIFLIVLLFFTQSRSALIGLVIGMSISLVLFYKAHINTPVIISMIIAITLPVSVFLFAYLNGISLRDKAANYMHYRLDSTDTHVLLLEGSEQIFVDNFAIGAGYGNFDYAFRGTPISDTYFNREPRLKDMKVPPHSVWGEVLAETGAVGLTLYAMLAVLVTAGLAASIFSVRSKEQKVLGIGLLGGALSILVSGLFYSYNLEFYWLFLFMCIGYVIVSLKEDVYLSKILNWWYDKDILPYLIILPPALFYIFLRLGSTTLIDWDEAIYAKVAKNIVQTGEWLSLHWNTLDKYWFEKPPLYMWMSASLFKTLGVNALSARLPSAIFGVSGVVLVYKFGRLMYNKMTGVFAALILLSTIHYLYYARNGMLDVTVTFFITATLYFFYKGYPAKRGSPATNYILSGIMLGLGVMTKAVIGLLPIPIIVLVLLHRWKIEKKKVDLRGLWYLSIAMLLVAVPWHLYSYIVHGSTFIHKYFFEHMLERGMSGFGHEKPLFWFLEVIKVSFRIWVAPLIGGLLFLPFVDKAKRSQIVFLTVSALFVLVFFSISKDKLQWYIIPIYPFIAIISARFLERSIVIANSVLHHDMKFDYSVLRMVGVFLVYVVTVFYIVQMRDRVWYPDTNKDKVALVKIFNTMYPIEDHPDKKLYFGRSVTPVLLFYSDHKIKSTNEDHILKTVENAKPDESNMFLLSNDMFYSVKSRGGEITAPLSLDPKGSAGGWILIKAESRVDILNGQFAVLKLEKETLEQKEFAGTITPLERERLVQVQKELDEKVQKLTEYGYPPF